MKMAAANTKDFVFNSTPLGRAMFIEASAGTGKTWTLERLVLRFIVEKDARIERFLIVTFTRAATGELSERVRKILKSALASLAALEAEERGEEPSADPDPSIRALWEEWKQTEAGSCARERIARAIEEFDRCAIHTIHSFCQKMLQAWAFSGGMPFDGQIGDGAKAEADAIEAWKRRWIAEFKDRPGDQDRVDAFSGKALLKALLSHPGCEGHLVFPEFPQPEGGQPGGEKTFGDALRDFAVSVPAEIERRKAEAGIFTYDDIIRRMAAALRSSPAFAEIVRSQFQAVLIDEFQDTDSLQYFIFSSLFLEDGGSSFQGAVFVGDPKQSIYAFRGAEIDVYLRARDRAEQEAASRGEAGVLTLSTNFRTTPAAVDAVNVLFTEPDGTSRFARGIDCIPVKSTPERLPLFSRNPETGALAPADAFEIWTQEWIPGGSAKDLPKDFDDGKYLVVESRRKAEARLIAEDAVRLLNAETYVGARLADPKVKTLEEARLKPGDIAILVLRHKLADAVQAELARRGVHCLHAQGDDVFSTPEARDVLSVMKALADPGDRHTLNSARTTPLCGRTLADVAGAGEGGEAGELWIEDLDRFRRAAALCARRGFAAAMEMLFSEFRTTARVLLQKGGERSLTNWEHTVELLHAEWEKAKSLPALIRWFESTMETGAGSDSDSRRQRTESDASLVRVETVFAAKGLEYPVVYAAGAGDAFPRAESKDPALLQGKDGTWRYFLSLAENSEGDAELKGEKKEAMDGISAAARDEMTQKAYVWATRASARFALPLLPGYYRKKLAGGSAGSAWMQLIAPGADAKYRPRLKNGKPAAKEKRPDEAVIADRVNNGLAVLEDRLLKESTFAGAKGSRLKMAEFLKKQAADAPEEKRAVLLEAAASLEALSPAESLAHVKTLPPGIQFEEPPERLALRGSAAEAVSCCLEAKPLLSDWRSSSYSSVTRGFELQAEAASAEKDPDEGYEETEPAEAELLQADAPDPLSDPAFLAGGKDTGDAVHNVLEACVRRDLHREGGVDAEKWDEIFGQAFRAAPGSRLLGRKVRHPERTPGESLSEEERKADDEAARSWLMDRAKGVFEANWGTAGRPLFLSKSPRGCASPELPFSMRVKGGIFSEDFAKRILEANAALPEGKRLPLAPLRVEGRDHSLRGYLEGRIDLLFEAGDGRFWIADWKTDQPGEKGRRRYDEDAMRAVMVREKYGWQALFYLVAVMRMLSDGYGIEKEEALSKLAGMAYVFVRGFSAARPAAAPAAVILEPAAELVLLADRLLEGEEGK